MFKGKNKDTRMTPRRCGVFANFEHFSYLALGFLLLNLNM